MRILLIGGGTGGHITPLLAVAHELKKLDASVELIGVCEKQSKFVSLYRDDKSIDRVFQVRAGKYRRYSGLPFWQKVTDIKSLLLNTRDIVRTVMGYFEAKDLLRQLKPDIILIKGGFVAVPMGKAAAKLGVPYITHDSDSTPGLANRIISKEATVHATGMPIELYDYPRSKTVFTGIPLKSDYVRVTPALRAYYRDSLGLSACNFVISVIGGSQGAQQLNNDMVEVTARLMKKYKGLGVIIVAGKTHEKPLKQLAKENVDSDASSRVIIKGFVNDLQVYSGAADVIVSRASATSTAEFALQGLPVIMVPGRLAGNHQKENADYFSKKGAALTVAHQDQDSLYDAICELIDNNKKRADIARALNSMAKPEAAKELAELTIKFAKKQG